MAASPEYYQPTAVAAYAPRLRPLAATTEPADDDEYFTCMTPRGAGIRFLGDALTCPPAPRKPRPPPACQKRLFTAADAIALRFDELEAMFRPAPLAGKPRRRGSKDKLGSNSRKTVPTILT